MPLNKIAKVVVGLPVEGPFDYLLPPSMRDSAKVGARVKVSFHNSRRIGYIIGLRAKSGIKKLKSVIALIDAEPVLDGRMLSLAEEFSRYYACSLGEAIEAALPGTLRRGRPVEIFPARNEPVAAQSTAEHVLIHDPDGENRWPLLIERISAVLRANKSVIFLVPEISILEHVKIRLGPGLQDTCLIWDKHLKSQKERDLWAAVRNARANVVIGTRSAVFAPVNAPGLVIVYDEENSAYKQEQSPFYHAREVALMRSRAEGCDVVFVSSAPSAETWHMAQGKKAKMISCPVERNPQIQVVDMANYKQKRGAVLSVPLRNSMEKAIADGGKTVLFMNRKGFTTQTRCDKCGHVVRCERCDINLTYLYSKKKMVCRRCNYTQALPRICPKCNNSYLLSTGMGIEKFESEIARILPQSRVQHYESETKSLPRSFNVLIATQAVVRLKDQLEASVLGCVTIDNELNRLDFRCAQRTFSLLTHLKQMVFGKMILQTRIPDNYCLKAFQRSDAKSFYRDELKFRREIGFPPYRHLVAVGLRGAEEETVLTEASLLHAELEKSLPKGTEILDPHPDVMPKLRDKYRFTVILKGKSIKQMLTVLKKTLRGLKRKRAVTVTINVDP